MNYLRQIKGFSLRRQRLPLSCSAITLYYLLLEIFNSAGFPHELSIPLGRLTAEASLGKTALCRARRELSEKGYISVIGSKSSARAAVYSLLPLYPADTAAPKEV